MAVKTKSFVYWAKPLLPKVVDRSQISSQVFAIPGWIITRRSPFKPSKNGDFRLTVSYPWDRARPLNQSQRRCLPELP
jgi:hypothetical protein